jgi:UDP-N-acetylmuramate-alanine ligase
MALRRVHFIAIGGTGMGSLAGLLKARGIRVTGSDRELYPPMSTALERWQIPVHEGFEPEHVLGEKPDLVVIGNAVRPDNPEARAAIDAGIPYLSFSDALYRHAIEGKHPVVVSGTHGKTTVTSLIATLLLETGREPSFLVGGIAGNFDTSFREAPGEHFVVEGDEYGGIRPRRHLPRPRAREGGVPRTGGEDAARRGDRGGARARDRARGGKGRALPRGGLRPRRAGARGVGRVRRRGG